MMSSSEEEVMLLCALRRKRRHRRRFSVHPYNKINIKMSQWLSCQQLRKYPEKFFNYFRMSVESFDYLLELISPTIMKESTNWKEPVSPGERLAITLRFLAEGCSYHQLSYDYFRGVTTIGDIVPETCDAIWSVLQPLFMPVPDRAQWMSKARRFEELWNLPHCVGAIDGKHIRIKAFDKSVSTHYNYKQYFSVVLLACADADSEFITIEVGAPGRNSDGGVFRTSSLGKWIASNSFHLPEPEPLPNDEENGPVAFYFCADAAFPLGKTIIRPYPKRVLNNVRRIFNYRLSRGRKSVECAFGIMTEKFRVFEKPIECTPEHLKSYVKAACVLHNFIKRRDGQYSLPENFVYKPPKLTCIDDCRKGRRAAYSDREKLARYFVCKAPVPNQWEILPTPPAIQ